MSNFESHQLRRIEFLYLKSTEHCGEDVQLDRLLSDPFSLLYALCKVVQHLKPETSTTLADTCSFQAPKLEAKK